MGLWEDLMEVLRLELELHRQLKNSIESLKAAIFQRDIEVVRKQIEIQAGYKKEIEEAEQARAALCREISLAMGIEVVSVSALSGYVPNYISLEFNGLVEELKKEIEEIKAHTRSIRYIIRTVLHYVEDLLEVYLCETEQTGSQYDANGQKKRAFVHFTTKLA